MNFSQALYLLKEGYKIYRRSWNTKGMHLVIFKMHTHTTVDIGGEESNLLPFIVIRTADGKFVPWTASQSDLLASDWENEKL